MAAWPRAAPLCWFVPTSVAPFFCGSGGGSTRPSRWGVGRPSVGRWGVPGRAALRLARAGLRWPSRAPRAGGPGGWACGQGSLRGRERTPPRADRRAFVCPCGPATPLRLSRAGACGAGPGRTPLLAAVGCSPEARSGFTRCRAGGWLWIPCAGSASAVPLRPGPVPFDRDVGLASGLSAFSSGGAVCWRS